MLKAIWKSVVILSAVRATFFILELLLMSLINGLSGAFIVLQERSQEFLNVAVEIAALQEEERLAILRPEKLPNPAVAIARQDAVVLPADGPAPDIEHPIVGTEIRKQFAVRADRRARVLGIAEEDFTRNERI